MQITKIKDLIASLHEVHGNNWSLIAHAVQTSGFYTEMDVRSLADKIRKAVSRGALSHLNINKKNDDESEDCEAETVTVNPYTCGEDTKLKRLHEVISVSADGILEIAGFDPNEFRLESCKFQFWNAFCKSKRGGRQISELFSASVSATPKRAIADT
ncbi:MAG: hypothetical protein LBI03_07720 [Clostridiales bacterium]|jgi:hypothetical protein|nr:hypothetical protein [Clostridiales bacterium]